MYKGWIINESLESDDIFSKVDVISEEKDEDPETGESVIFYTIGVEDEDIEKIVEILENEIKPGWYVHLTNGERLIVSFKDRSFTMELDSEGEETEFGIIDFRIRPQEADKWQELIEYTKEVDVGLETLINVEWF